MRQPEGQPQKSGFKDFVSNRATSAKEQLKKLIQSSNHNTLNPSFANATAGKSAIAGGINVNSPEVSKVNTPTDPTVRTKESTISKRILTFPSREPAIKPDDGPDLRDRTVIAPPKPDVDITPDEAKEIRRKHERDQKRGNKLVTTAKITGAVTGVGSAIAGVGYAAVPAIHQGIDQIRQELGERTGQHWIAAGTGNIDAPFEVTEVPIVFDNTLKEGVIGDNNIVRIPQEEIIQQFPTAFEKLNDGKNTLQLALPLDTSESIDPDAPLTYTKSFSGYNAAERDAYQNKEFYDTYEFKNRDGIVPGGTIIKAPVDGYFVIGIDQNNPPTDPGRGNVMDGAIFFEAPNGNQYRIIFSGATTKDLQEGRLNPQTGYIFRSLMDAPIITKEDRKKPTGNYGIAVKSGDPILAVVQPPDDTIGSVGFRIMAQEGEIGKPSIFSDPSIPTNADFLITSDGKVILPQ